MNQPAILRSGRKAAAGVAVALALTGLGLSGCSVVSKINKVKNTVQGNEGIVDTRPASPVTRSRRRPRR